MKADLFPTQGNIEMTKVRTPVDYDKAKSTPPSAKYKELYGKGKKSGKAKGARK